MADDQNKKFIIPAAGGLVVGAVLTFLIQMLLSSSGGDNPVVAKYNGNNVRAEEAFQSIKTRLFDLEEEMYRLKERAISDYVEQRLLLAESEKKNMPIPQLIEKEMGGEEAEVTDKEITEFLTSKGLSLNDPRIRKEDVKDYLKFRQRHEKRQTYVDKLKAQANVQILLKEPESPKIAVSTDGYPVWGKASAPVTIVEFSDFECPYCSRVVPTIARIKQEYGEDKVRIVFRDMPLPSHPRAIPAAIASHCAHDQGKFWEFHDVLFENQRKLGDEDLKAYAKKIGLDEAKFAECYSKGQFKDRVEGSQQEAQRVGIQATPSFVINGTLLQGAQPFEKFKEKIDRILSKG
ncbi:MAG: thioredoxin domain-containing protein [Bdellovibrionales bacterium]|nr:thioredoxin domain-containing protein [Bdellovibrionales bacterium]